MDFVHFLSHLAAWGGNFFIHVKLSHSFSWGQLKYTGFLFPAMAHKPQKMTKEVSWV